MTDKVYVATEKDCEEIETWVMGVFSSREKADEIIALLCEFGELDGDLWRKKKVIWWYAFVKSLKELYKRRKNQLPEKDDFILVLLSEEGFRGTKEEEEELRDTEIHKV